MAAVDEGVARVASSRHSERCTGTNAKGNPCNAWALTDGSGLCLAHADPEAWRAQGRRAGKARQEQRREAAGLRKSSGHRQAVPGPTLAQAIEVVAELLDAEIPDGSHEPNYPARALGVLALSSLFGLRAEHRAEILAVLERVRPALARDPHRARLLDFERASEALVRAYREGRVSALDLPPELLGLATAEDEAEPIAA